MKRQMQRWAEGDGGGVAGMKSAPKRSGKGMGGDGPMLWPACGSRPMTGSAAILPAIEPTTPGEPERWDGLS